MTLVEVRTGRHGTIRIEAAGDLVRLSVGGLLIELSRDEAWRLAEALDATSTRP